MTTKLNYIDLFAGSGGLSEGFKQAGFNPIAHVEMDANACDTLKTRAAYHYLNENNKTNIYFEYLKSKEKNKEDLWDKIPQHLIEAVINKEIKSETIPEIFQAVDKALGKEKLNLIIGGPPCQAYSVAGRARDKKGMREDPRNYLYIYYIEFLKRYQPKMFVFENVPGIISANNGIYLDKIFKAAEDIGYELAIPPKNYLNAKNFNVLQNRKRVIIIGCKKELKLRYPNFQDLVPKYKVLKDLFSDLPHLTQGQGTKNAVRYIKPATHYLQLSKIRDEKTNFVTQHIARKTNKNDLEIYRMAVDSLATGKKLNYATLPKRLIRHKNTKTFTNRFKVVNGEDIAHTVVAHISADGHYYIHPDKKQNRSITPREAARIQSFPDNYFFEGSRTAVFKQIGNAVPPLMAEKIAEQLKALLL